MSYNSIHPSRAIPILGLVLVLLPSSAWSQRRIPWHGQTPQTPSGTAPYFDPSTLTTLSGELAGVADEWEMWGHGNFTGGGLHFVLAADEGQSYNLMLGPEWFLADRGLTLHQGDRVTVTGSMVEPYGEQPWMDGPHGPSHGGGGAHGGHPGGGPGPGPVGAETFFVVTVLEVDGISVALRDDQGYPLWHGGPAGGMGPWFDPDSMVHLRGTLTSVLGFWNPWGYGNYTGSGMHYLFVAETGETFYAMLAPWWYLDRQGLVLEPGEIVELMGSVVEPYWAGYDEHRYLIATEISVGEMKAALRDTEGYPIWRGTGGSYYAPEYAPASEVTLHASVQRARSASYGGNRDHGYEALLFSQNGVSGDAPAPARFMLFIAPRWYVESRGFALRDGEQIEVVGSRVRDFENRPALVARQIRIEGRTWTFRDQQGYPVWMHGAP